MAKIKVSFFPFYVLIALPFTKHPSQIFELAGPKPTLDGVFFKLKQITFFS